MPTSHLNSVALHRSRRVAEFRLEVEDESVGDSLLAMGFERRANAYVRVVPDSPGIPQIFENFSAHIEEMIRHKRGEVRAPWELALRTSIRRLSGEVTWWLAGSAALAIRGVPVHPRDIDLVVDDAIRAGALFDDILVEPVRQMKNWVAEWHGRAFDHALIEWVTPAYADVDASTLREDGHAARAQLESVSWEGHTVRCPPLGLQLRVAQARGRDDQSQAIQRFLIR